MPLMERLVYAGTIATNSALSSAAPASELPCSSRVKWYVASVVGTQKSGACAWGHSAHAVLGYCGRRPGHAQAARTTNTQRS